MITGIILIGFGILLRLYIHTLNGKGPGAGFLGIALFPFTYGSALIGIGLVLGQFLP